MTRIPAKMPHLVKRFYPNYVWDFSKRDRNSSEKNLYLTFDDGPIPETTEFVLDTLEEFNAQATFFCIGANVEKHPEVFNKVISQGHTIGNHTQHHIEGWNTSTKDYIDNTLLGETHIRDHNNHKLFRPPYGRIKRAQGRKLTALGYRIIMWDVLAKDWMLSVTEESCLKNILDNSINGSIVVMHDSVKAFKNVKYALPRVLDHFSNKGFQFKKIEF